MGQLYKIQFKTSNKSYIGITTFSADHRWKSHIKLSNDLLLGRAFKKHGIDDAKLTVLAESDSWEVLCAMEISAIAEHNTMNPNGYNVVAGGRGQVGLKHTPEHKVASSERAKKMWASPEKRVKILESIRLAKAKPEFRDAISRIQKIAQNRPEVRAARSASYLAREQTPEGQEDRAKRTEAIKKKWAEQEFKAKMSASRKISHNKPEFLAAQVVRLKLAQNRPDVLAANSARGKKQWESHDARIRNKSAIAIGHAKKAGRAFSYIPFVG